MKYIDRYKIIVMSELLYGRSDLNIFVKCSFLINLKLEVFIREIYIDTATCGTNIHYQPISKTDWVF